MPETDPGPDLQSAAMRGSKRSKREKTRWASAIVYLSLLVTFLVVGICGYKKLNKSRVFIMKSPQMVQMSFTLNKIQRGSVLMCLFLNWYSVWKVFFLVCCLVCSQFALYLSVYHGSPVTNLTFAHAMLHKLNSFTLEVVFKAPATYIFTSLIHLANGGWSTH